MSKKRLHSRLENLFAHLASEGEAPSAPAAPQQAAQSAAQPRINPPQPRVPGTPALAPQYGVALQNQTITPAQEIWTATGEQTLASKTVTFANGSTADPAIAAVPLHLQGVGDLLLEVVDDTAGREWSDDDRTLLMEVSAQLALALDNAQLYRSVQLELVERIRAEQETSRRNSGLAALNKIGQQLSRLASRSEIFNILAMMVEQVLASDNFYICTYSARENSLSFPIYRRDGQPVNVPPQPFGNGIAEYVLRNRAPLLAPTGALTTLHAARIEPPQPAPLSFLAIPLLTGDRPVGAIVAQSFVDENIFDTLDAELLSTAAAQAATALENADLFEQMQEALRAIETRERYQAGVAQAVAMLTETGTRAIADVLNILGKAALCSRVYFAPVIEDEHGSSWQPTFTWSESASSRGAQPARAIPVNEHPHWLAALRERGWMVTQASGESDAAAFSGERNTSALLLSVAGDGAYPGLLAFEQHGARGWMIDEINSLHVAADAISNTFVREGLLRQLQATLEETEDLYLASNSLALANALQDMVRAVVTGVHAADINRAELVLFSYGAQNTLAQMRVAANWHRGTGTPPEPVGAELDPSAWASLVQTKSPLFLDDVGQAQIDHTLRAMLRQRSIRALAVLPLHTAKQQTGVLLLQADVAHAFRGRETRTYPPLVDQMTIAVENQRLLEQTEKALAETGLLYNISNRIAQAAGPQDMLALVTEILMPADAERATLVLLETDPAGEPLQLEVVGFQERGGAYQPLGAHLLPKDLPLLRDMHSQPLLISALDETALDTESRSWLQELGAAAGCIVPLQTSGSLTGFLVVSARQPVTFADQEIHLLQIAGNGIAVSLEKQRLLRQAQRRALELQTASEIARDTASTLSLDLLLQRIVNMLSERFGFYHVSIFLLDEAKIYAQIREATGTAGQQMKQQGARARVGSLSVVGKVTATGKPYILNDVTQSALAAADTVLDDTRSEMGIPLMLNDAVIGALDMQARDRNAFHADDLTVLTILADQIAIAIENAQAYELSQKAIAEMKEIDRVKSQFLANMSHELRTPLNSIIGFSRVILKGIDGPINEVQQQDMTAIYQSGQHLLSLINDILDLSRIEAGKMELAFAEVNLVDLINSAMATAVGLVKDKPIRLHTILPEQLPTVRADQIRVRQVLINFLSNAAKFTDEGTVTVEARAVTSPTGQPEVMVCVTDSGPGIAEADQAKLFQPFSQVDDSPTRKTGGSGLGLSICRSLIDMHSGRIGLLHSEVGAGSTFFFTLPVNAPQEEIALPEADDENLILAIDDDPKITGLYERYLKPHGYHVVALNNPAQAVRKVKELHPFAVTLDLMMPGKDGWQVLQDLKNHPETSQIPVIICSILENQEKGFRLGATDYLVKPFLQEDMLSALEKLNGDGRLHEVLVIDDQMDDLLAIEQLIAQHCQQSAQRRFHVTSANSTAAGWAAIQAQRPDIILLNLFMDEMRGFELLRTMQAAPDLKHIPIILLASSELSEEQQRQAAEFGKEVLAKEYLRSCNLLELVEETLQAHKAQHNHSEPDQA